MHWRLLVYPTDYKCFDTVRVCVHTVFYTLWPIRTSGSSQTPMVLTLMIASGSNPTADHQCIACTNHQTTAGPSWMVSMDEGTQFSMYVPSPLRNDTPLFEKAE